MIESGCGQCGRELLPSQRVYCSRRCSGLASADRPHPTGDKHPLWKGGRHVRDEKYIRIWTPTGYQYEHRVVVENMIGRSLQTHEHVHHLNGDKHDNRPENLVVMGIREHGHRHKPVATARWSRLYDSCQECGTTEKEHYGKGLCSICYMRILNRRNAAARAV